MIRGRFKALYAASLYDWSVRMIFMSSKSIGVRVSVAGPNWNWSGSYGGGEGVFAGNGGLFI